MGACSGNSVTTHGVRYGCGARLSQRLRDGSCRVTSVIDRDALAAEKEILENRLRRINQRLHADFGKSMDRPND